MIDYAYIAEQLGPLDRVELDPYAVGQVAKYLGHRGLALRSIVGEHVHTVVWTTAPANDVDGWWG